MKNITLITRPAKDARAFAKQLDRLNLDNISAPMLQIKNLRDTPPDLPDKLGDYNTYAIVTSANAVRALANLSIRRNLRIIAIGETSGKEAQKLGYQHIDINKNAINIKGLCQHIADNYNYKKHKFIYLSAEITSSNLIDELKLHHRYFNIRREIIYRAKPMREFPDKMLININNIRYATFFSERSAQNFCKLAKIYELDCSHITAIAISKNITKTLQLIDWCDIAISDGVNESAVIKIILDKENG